MKKLLLCLLFVGLGLVSIVHFSKIEIELDEAQNLYIHEYYDMRVLNNKVRDMVNKANTLKDLEYVENQLDLLSKDHKENIVSIIAFKKSTILFNQAEDYLNKATEIEDALAEPKVEQPMPPPMPDPENTAEVLPPPTKQKDLHPLTVANLTKAVGLYDQARKIAEKMKDSGNSDFDYHLNYLKGEIYYRCLEFATDQESATELFNQALTYYKYALRNRNGDINTVVNIEIMIKNQSRLIGTVSEPQARKKQMLNSKKYGVGKSSGN